MMVCYVAVPSRPDRCQAGLLAPRQADGDRRRWGSGCGGLHAALPARSSWHPHARLQGALYPRHCGPDNWGHASGGCHRGGQDRQDERNTRRSRPHETARPGCCRGPAIKDRNNLAALVPSCPGVRATDYCFRRLRRRWRQHARRPKEGGASDARESCPARVPLFTEGRCLDGRGPSCHSGRTRARRCVDLETAALRPLSDRLSLAGARAGTRRARKPGQVRLGGHAARGAPVGRGPGQPLTFARASPTDDFSSIRWSWFT